MGDRIGSNREDGVAVVTIELPWPPTVNHLHAVVRGRKVLSKKGREYREAVIDIAGRQEAMQGRLSVQIDAIPPDRRKCDLDNRLKAILDGLTHANVWTDDSQIDHLSIRRLDPLHGNPGYVRVKVAEMV